MAAAPWEWLTGGIPQGAKDIGGLGLGLASLFMGRNESKRAASEMERRANAARDTYRDGIPRYHKQAEEALRSSRAENVNELLKALRRSSRRGSGGLIDRERIDDISGSVHSQDMKGFLMGEQMAAREAGLLASGNPLAQAGIQQNLKGNAGFATALGTMGDNILNNRSALGRFGGMSAQDMMMWQYMFGKNAGGPGGLSVHTSKPS